MSPSLSPDTALSLDMQVKEQLKAWPQRPPGLIMPRCGRHVWLRARPSDDPGVCQPCLKVPGSTRLRTIPDGLWLNFGGTMTDRYVDIFAIEACSTLQNLCDKRSRYVQASHSLVAVCPLPWLLMPATPDDHLPRWQAIGVLLDRPLDFVTFPVRERRVLFALKREHYDEFTQHQLAHGHEMFVPIEALLANGSHKRPDLRALLHRMSPVANFLSVVRANRAYSAAIDSRCFSAV